MRLLEWRRCDCKTPNPCDPQPVREKEYVRGHVHTNTIENVFSLLKRSIVGSYHKVSTKHLDAYLDEMEWRFNNRENPYLFRDTLRKLIESENMKYQELAAS